MHGCREWVRAPVKKIPTPPPPPPQGGAAGGGGGPGGENSPPPPPPGKGGLVKFFFKQDLYECVKREEILPGIQMKHETDQETFIREDRTKKNLKRCF